ncbi:MAG: 3-dehydroquinate synthase [Gammaproteobacteria bacterium]|nr:3-dehydroquinate synthase [Gammaproteobacteria bacterium]
MQTLTVDLGERSYPIHIGSNLLGDSQLIAEHIQGQQVMVVTNETVAPLYLEKCLSMLTGFRTETVILPDGEQYKNLDVLNNIYDALLTHHFDRRCTLIALGGGVVGDMTGFAAASYQRGVNFIQIPTTLLSQVDSSVGGKTGVNHPLGKNMIGAFHQPQCVIADTDTLMTLDDRQLSAGIAEVIKYGFINDLEFIGWLETNMDKLLQRDSSALSYAIKVSCQDKADIVAADEKEAGQRALLNLGHTFGHAIETGMGYGEWLHGEAIASGMVLAAELSEQLGWIDAEVVNRVRTLVASANLPTTAPKEMSAQQFIDLMAVDKKVIDGKLRLVLMDALGSSVIAEGVDQKIIERVLNRSLEAAA